MQKYLFSLAVILFLGAGCNMSKPAEKSLPNQNQQPQTAGQNTSLVINTTTAAAVQKPPVPQSKPSDPNWKSNAEKTVSDFLNYIFNSNSGNNVNLAVGEFTAGAQAMIKAHSPNSNTDGLVAGLSYILNIEYLPNKGVFISNITMPDNTVVLVETKWYYSGQTNLVKKVFVLNRENVQWKISSIQ